MRNILILMAATSLAACATNAPDLGARAMRAVSTTTIPEGPFEQQFALAKSHIERKNEALAIEILRRINREHPNEPRVLNALAVAYDKIGRFDVSKRYYELAMGIAPEADYIAHNVGYSLQMQGKHAEAHAFLEKAKTSPDAEVSRQAELADASAAVKARPLPVYVYAERPQRVTRASARVQSLNFDIARDEKVALAVDIDTELALLSIEDDRAVAGGMTTRPRQRQEWEALALGALKAIAARQDLKIHFASTADRPYRLSYVAATWPTVR